MSRLAKDLTKACIHLVPNPIQRIALQAAALAPPAMKTEAFELVCSTVARTSFPNSQEIFLTNLGVSPQLRCKLPLAKRSYLFGRPSNLLGERATLALVTELCGDCTDFLDVGANDGIFTFAVSHSASRGVRLHWFEPDKTLYERLSANLTANSIRTLGNCTAVAAERTTAKFFRNLTNDSSGSLLEIFASMHQTVVEEVDTISLTEYFRDQGIHNAIVKVDVEGAGDQVWRGAKKASPAMRYLFMEMIGPETECRLAGRVISEGGFDAYYIRDFDLVASKDGAYEYVAPFWNWLFCRLNPGQLRARLRGTRFRVIESAQIK